MLKSFGGGIVKIVKVIFRAIYSLVQEPKGGKDLSLGRVAFWGVLGVAMYIWVYKGENIPLTMENFLMVIVAYVFGDKVVHGAKDLLTIAKKGVTPPDEENDGPVV